jgi:enoyl-CoA hydratase
LLDRNVELATKICVVAAPVIQGLKAVYVAGAAAIINPALAAEQTIATNGARHTDDLGNAIDKSQNVIDGRSTSKPEVESLS